jgi:predicted PurR-regulated permease PerM
MRATLPQTRPGSGLARAGAAAWSLLGIAAVVLLAGWAIGRLMAVVLPFVIAILLATLLRPVAARLERRGLRPATAAIAAVALAIVVLAVLLSLVLPPFIARLSDLGTSVQEGAHRVAYEVGDRVAGMSHAEVDRTIENAVKRMRDRVGGTAMAGVTSPRARSAASCWSRSSPSSWSRTAAASGPSSSSCSRATGAPRRPRWASVPGRC